MTSQRLAPAARPSGERLAPALVLAALLAALSGRGDAASLQPLRSFAVRGGGNVRILGPSCCGTAVLPARFSASYEIDATGGVTLGSFGVEIADTNVGFPGFLGLTTETVRLRCASISALGAAGSLDALGNVFFPAGAIELEGRSFETRKPDRSCETPFLALAVRNDAPVVATHDPAGNLFRLSGTFRTRHDGGDYDVLVDLVGTFANRPPNAALGIVVPGDLQPHCPATWRFLEQTWRLVAEANGPEGLKGSLRSTSNDPDGTWGAGDVGSAVWYYAADGAPLTPFAEGYEVGPFTFGFGPFHRIDLLAADGFGAADATECAFTVVDTTPPAVTPPPAASVEPTEPGGARPSASAALKAFLYSSAKAVDLVDPLPSPLPPRLDGVAVTGSTLFPADGVKHVVTFAFEDRFGNVGAADTTIVVLPGKAPKGAAR